jgi:hypothetical protein
MSRIPSSLLTSAGLIGGFAAARASGNRTAGGVVLAALGAATFAAAQRNSGTGRAIALTVGYLAAFGLSHPLAKKLGAWPSVFTVAGATAVAAQVLE